MEARFDTETIRLINAFENVTGAPVKDCVIDTDGKTVYFIVDEGKIGIAIGKNGSSVKQAEHMIKKSIKIFEFSSDLAAFAKNLMPQSSDIKVKAEGEEIVIEVRVDRGQRPLLIGRDGKNIKLYKELLQRNHNVNDVVIK
jgi:N utilization substance protein A